MFEEVWRSKGGSIGMREVSLSSLPLHTELSKQRRGRRSQSPMASFWRVRQTSLEIKWGCRKENGLINVVVVKTQHKDRERGLRRSRCPLEILPRRQGARANTKRASNFPSIRQRIDQSWSKQFIFCHDEWLKLTETLWARILWALGRLTNLNCSNQVSGLKHGFWIVQTRSTILIHGY